MASQQHVHVNSEMPAISICKLQLIQCSSFPFSSFASFFPLAILVSSFGLSLPSSLIFSLLQTLIISLWKSTHWVYSLGCHYSSGHHPLHLDIVRALYRRPLYSVRPGGTLFFRFCKIKFQTPILFRNTPA